MAFEFELVGKIGSMALIQRQDNDIDYNIFNRIGRALRPGMIWVSSGATEIGRLDYMHRTGKTLEGDADEIKTDYAAQGQSILMTNYRQFVRPEYSVRQVLVEHQHFNDEEKREHLRRLFIRAAEQGAIPIVNYNDPVSAEENRKMELSHLRMAGTPVVECVDNDETAAVIAKLVRARKLVIMTSAEGIYRDPNDPSTRIDTITGKTYQEVEAAVREAQKACIGASRAGANGARAKLEFALQTVAEGTTVIIGHARYPLDALASGDAPSTRIGVGL